LGNLGVTWGYNKVIELGIKMNKDDLEQMVDELGIKAVASLLATICLEKAERARTTQGYNSAPSKAWLNDSAKLRALMVRLVNS
jgi:hypothetical protein